MAKLGTPAIPSELKIQVTRALNARVAEDGHSLGSDHGRHKQKTQDCNCIENLLWASTWEAIQDMSVPYQSVLLQLKRNAEAIGLVAPTEPTFVAFAVALLVGRMPKNNFRVDIQQAWTLVQDMKDTLRPGKRAARQPHWGKILKYPNTIAELKADHPDVFEVAYPPGNPHQAPMDCPLDAHVLSQLKDVLPARESHRLISRTSTKLKRSLGTALSIGSPAAAGQLMLPGWRCIAAAQSPGSRLDPARTAHCHHESGRVAQPQLHPGPRVQAALGLDFISTGPLPYAPAHTPNIPNRISRQGLCTQGNNRAAQRINRALQLYEVGYRNIEYDIFLLQNMKWS